MTITIPDYAITDKMGVAFALHRICQMLTGFCSREDGFIQGKRI
jgi:hypothetical protein